MDLTQATPGSSPLYVVLAFRPDNSGASQLLNLGNGSVTFIISSVTITIGSGAPITLPSSTITFGAQVLLYQFHVICFQHGLWLRRSHALVAMR